jgi:hypothetical protein
MGAFREWINAPQFSAWYKDGTIVVWIDGKEYRYGVDRLYHPRLQQLAKHQPGAAFNKILNMVKDKVATQLSPHLMNSHHNKKLCFTIFCT